MKTVLKSLIGRESMPEKAGPRIAAIRAALGLSKSEFADSIGVDRSYYTKIERGNVGLSISNAELLALNYSIGLDFIYRGDLLDVPENLRPNLVKALSDLVKR